MSRRKKGRLHRVTKGSVLPEDLDWVREDMTDVYVPMAAQGKTAQTHPYQFTTSMLTLAQEKGARLVKGKVTSIQYSRDDAATISDDIEQPPV